MADRFVLSQIRRLPLLSRLSPEQLAAVANAVQVVRYEPGTVVFRQGQPNEGLMLFVSGRGAFFRTGAQGQVEKVGTVDPGDYLNESSLFAENTAPATLQLTETAIVLFLSRDRLAQVLAQRPDIRSALNVARPAPASEGEANPPAPQPPESRQFAGQRPGERVLSLFRAHAWAFVGRLWVPLLAAILLFVLAALAAPTLPVLAVLLVLVGFVVPGALTLYFYVEWQNDKVIVTNQRVIRVRRTIRTVQTNVSEIPLGAIHEVNVTVPGSDIFARVFNYGSLIVKTSGDTLNLRLDYVPNPDEVQSNIFTFRDRYQEDMARQNREAMRKELDQFLNRSPIPTEPGTGTGGPIPRTAPPPRGSGGPLQMQFLNAKGESVYRKHWLIWLSHVFGPALIILVGLSLLILSIFQIIPGLGLVGFSLSFLVVLLGIGLFVFADWDWRNDLYIVGNETITIIRRRPLWLQDQNDQILLTQVDNVISEVSGFLSTLFKMGDVRLLLTGTEVQNAKVFRNVYRPQRIQEEISRRRDYVKRQRQEEEALRQRQAFLEYLSVYHDSLQEAANAAGNPGRPAAPEPPAPPAGHNQPTRLVDRSRPPGIPRPRGDDPQR